MSKQALIEIEDQAQDDESESTTPVEFTWQPTASQLAKAVENTPISNRVVARLITAFRNDSSISAACRYAAIDKKTYYRAMESNPLFALLMEEAQEALLDIAGKVIKRSLRDGSDVTARWYKERRDARFQPKQQLANQPMTNIQINVSDGRKPQDVVVDQPEQ